MPETQIDAKNDLDALVALKKAGKSYRQIAAMTNSNKDVIQRKIKDLLQDTELETYRARKIDLYETVEMMFLRCLDMETVKSLVDKRGLVDFGIVTDKLDRERNGSRSQAKPMIQINIGNTSTDKVQIIEVQGDDPGASSAT